MTRRPVVLVLLAGLAALLALDLGRSAPLDPYSAPPLAALGSGLAASGAHCSELPGR
jgi:hypothetical protein